MVAKIDRLPLIKRQRCVSRFKPDSPPSEWSKIISPCMNGWRRCRRERTRSPTDGPFAWSVPGLWPSVSSPPRTAQPKHEKAGSNHFGPGFSYLPSFISCYRRQGPLFRRIAGFCPASYHGVMGVRRDDKRLLSVVHRICLAAHSLSAGPSLTTPTRRCRDDVAAQHVRRLAVWYHAPGNRSLIWVQQGSSRRVSAQEAAADIKIVERRTWNSSRMNSVFNIRAGRRRQRRASGQMVGRRQPRPLPHRRAHMAGTIVGSHAWKDDPSSFRARLSHWKAEKCCTTMSTAIPVPDSASGAITTAIINCVPQCMRHLIRPCRQPFCIFTSHFVKGPPLNLSCERLAAHPVRKTILRWQPESPRIAFKA